MGFGWWIVVLSVVVGVCVALASGLVENVPGGVVIPEKRHYGFPLIWRTSDPFVGEAYLLSEFVVDCVVWVVFVFVVVLLAVKVRERQGSSEREKGD